MGSTRRFATAMVVAAAVGAATIGVTAAVADQDEQPSAGTNDAALLERLGALEAELPDPYAEFDEDHYESAILAEDDEDDVAFDVYTDYFSDLRGAMTPLEDDLRRLFVDADDGKGDVATAVAAVASGWLDLANSFESFATFNSHDLEFPRWTSDDDGVATGADRLRGLAEQALDLYLRGADKHYDGYLALRDLSVAEPSLQTVIDRRAADLERYDHLGRPFLTEALSQPSTTVLVPVDRYETLGPGVESRASSLSYVCVDRELFEAETRPLTDEVLLELAEATPERLDCGPFGAMTELLQSD